MTTMAEVREANRNIGHCWFEYKTMKFWHTKIHGDVRRGKYFITSEDNYNRQRRLFTIREFKPDGQILTVGEFQAYKSLAEAKQALKEIV